MWRLLPIALLGGCAIAERSDKFGAGLEFELGGLIGYVASVKFKADVGFSKTCKEDHDGTIPGVPGALHPMPPRL